VLVATIRRILLEKRYQVFVSSTYKDLIKERQEVILALLELDCIPSGMELFPASNEDQWSLIKGVIDDCDYYMVIIGGRYGSIGSTGISYTEMEYRYALDIGKPVIGFLCKNPEEIPAKNTEPNEKYKKSLDEFRELVGSKNCQYWENSSDLGSKVSRSLIKLIKKHPSKGWIRGYITRSKEIKKVFFSMQMSGLEGQDYIIEREKIMKTVEELRLSCNTVVFFNEQVLRIEDFDESKFDGKKYISDIDDCDLFAAVITQKAFSSIYFEVGYALGKKKQCLVFVTKKDVMPLVMRHLSHHKKIKIFYEEKLHAIENIIKSIVIDGGIS
jgi:nucleoside 2-deoxyribosyltransferase